MVPNTGRDTKKIKNLNTEENKRNDNKRKQTPPTPPIGKLIATLTKRADVDSASWARAKTWKNITAKFLLTRDDLYEDPITHRGNTTWRAKNQEEEHIGGIQATIYDFVANRHTFAYPSYSLANRDIQEIIRAIDHSTEPARAAILTTKDIPQMRTHKTQINTIASMNTNDIGLEHPKGRKLTQGTTWADVYGNSRIKLVTIQNYRGTTTDWRGMKREISVAFPEARIKWDEITNTQPKHTMTHHERNQTQQRPTLTWFRGDYFPPKQPNNGKRKRNEATHLETYHKLMGAMGMVPKQMIQDLRNLGYDTRDYTQETIHKIQNIIRETSLETYRRWENWRRRRKYEIDESDQTRNPVE